MELTTKTNKNCVFNSLSCKWPTYLLLQFTSRFSIIGSLVKKKSLHHVRQFHKWLSMNTASSCEFVEIFHSPSKRTLSMNMNESKLFSLFWKRNERKETFENLKNCRFHIIGTRFHIQLFNSSMISLYINQTLHHVVFTDLIELPSFHQLKLFYTSSMRECLCHRTMATIYQWY